MIIDDHFDHTVDQFRNSPAFIKGYVEAIERSYHPAGSVPMEIVRNLIKIIRGLVS